MAQFDVKSSSDGSQLLLDCQNDLLSHFDTRFVVPLIPAETADELSRLHPVFEIDGKRHMMATQLASAVDTSEIGKHVSSLADHHNEIMNALDMLISGY